MGDTKEFREKGKVTIALPAAALLAAGQMGILGREVVLDVVKIVCYSRDGGKEDEDGTTWWRSTTSVDGNAGGETATVKPISSLETD